MGTLGTKYLKQDDCTHLDSVCLSRKNTKVRICTSTSTEGELYFPAWKYVSWLGLTLLHQAEILLKILEADELITSFETRCCHLSGISICFLETCEMNLKAMEALVQ